MSTTHAFVEHYSSAFTYSLNSPDPASLSPLPTPSLPSAPSSPSSPSSPTSSSSRSRLSVTPPKAARRVSSQPSFPSPKSNSLAPPRSRHLPPLPPFTPVSGAKVLSSPNPAEAVSAARRSVQIAGGGPVNWSRPFPHPLPPLPVPTITSTSPPTSTSTSASPSPSPAASPTKPARSPTSPMRTRTVSATLALRSPYRAAAAAVSPASSAISTSDDEVLPTTPPLLPSGAAAPDCPPHPSSSSPSSSVSSRSWAVVSECKGLGMVGIAEFEGEQATIAIPEDSSCVGTAASTLSSCSSSTSEASLAGESVNTVSSTGSTPSTPTRLLFVSETLETLSNPATLDELRSLRAKAAELEKESKRLRRLRGREPVASPRLLPRKAVPEVTAIDLQAKPKPRRPAVRHSLIATPTADQSFAGLVADPLQVPSANAAPSAFSFGINRSAFAMPNHNAAAARRPFYAQGKAAMSVIEFSTRKAEQPAAPSLNPFSVSRTRHASGVVPTLASLRRDKGDKGDKRDAITVIPAVPVFDMPLSQGPSSVEPQRQPLSQSHSPPQPQGHFHQPPSPPSPSTPFMERTLSIKPSGGFLGKHKKLSRFLGKAQVA